MRRLARAAFASLLVGSCLANTSVIAAQADEEVSTTRSGFQAKVVEKKEKTKRSDIGATTTGGAEGTWRLSPACARQGEAICLEAATCADGSAMHNLYFTPKGTNDEVLVNAVCPSVTRPERREITSAMVLRALKRIDLPKPKMIVQPPGGRTLVNFETIFHTEAEPMNRTVRLLGQRVQLRIRPTGFTWTHGDGTTQYTEWAGMKFTKGVDMDRYISHKYTDAYVTVHPNVEVSYSADFRVGNGAWRTVPGTVDMAGNPVDLRIIEGRLTLLG